MTTSTTSLVLSIAVCVASSACASAAAERRQEEAAVQQESTAAELLKKGEASISVGDTTRAEQYYVSALKAGADPHLIVSKLLVVCVADQRFPAAIEYAEQYLYRRPNDLDIAFAAASLHAAVGEAPRARELLERVLHEYPNSAEAHYALASVLRKEGDALDLADQHDLAYLKLSPRGPFAETARARLNREVQ
jgi:tetratricopeptide (TPR) repeat protein